MTRCVLLLAALLCLASSAAAVPISLAPQSDAGPVIPYWQDWNIPVTPVLHAGKTFATPNLPEEEATRILPAKFGLGYLDSALEELQEERDSPRPVNAITGILVGTGLILVAYSLIPRAHSGVLRIRAMNLKADLST